MNSLFIRFIRSPSLNISKAGLKSWTGGIQYDGFRYFPRPGEKDPPFEPSKLLMVQRVKPHKGNPKVQKRIMFHLKLDGKCGEVVILKNIPEINALLYKIKHLIKVTPIRTPDGLPVSGDLSGGHLDENTGVFRVCPTVRPSEERLQITQDFQTQPSRLDSDTLIKQARDKWNNPW